MLWKWMQNQRTSQNYKQIKVAKNFKQKILHPIVT